MHKYLTESQALITEIRGIVRDEFRKSHAIFDTSILVRTCIDMDMK